VDFYGQKSISGSFFWSVCKLSSAASQAGVATAAGEEAKDDQYLNIVNQSEGDFAPLVCETLVYGLHLLCQPCLPLHN